jgi:hypothetical protein
MIGTNIVHVYAGGFGKALPEPAVKQFELADLRLREDSASDASRGSFRDNGYLSLIYGLTGISLYKELVPIEDIEKALLLLEDSLRTLGSAKIAARYSVSEKEVGDLIEFLSICAKNKLEISVVW